MSVRVDGQGLHGGAPSSVVFTRGTGPVLLRQRGVEAPVCDLEVAASALSTKVTCGALSVATCEHLFSALAGLGVYEGVVVEVVGAEVPLLDGGARAFVGALRALGVSVGAGRAPGAVPRASRIEVVEPGAVAVGESRYAFACGEGVGVEVSVDFGDPRIAPRAVWEGDAEDFLTRIAPARTFGFERDVALLAARGLASHVTPESVVVYGEGRVLAAGPPPLADEPARHKLLDLIGDMYLYGGPPRGRVSVSRPGHAATHEAMRIAVSRGLVRRVVERSTRGDSSAPGVTGV